MNLTANVFVLAVLDHLMRHRPFQVAITGMFIRRDQINFIADRVADKASQRFGIGVLDHFAGHIILARDRAGVECQAQHNPLPLREGEQSRI